MTTVVPGARPVGEQLRAWRQRRRLSQLALSIQAGISTRHLSFVETGRSAPSREMVLRLAEHLDVPLRDRNRLLLAAGFAPVHAESDLDSARLAPVRSAVRQVLTGHEPYPAVAVDRRWNLVDANSAVALFTAGVAAHLLTPPVNVLRLSLHPDGMAPRIVNLREWRGHLLGRLRRQVALTGDSALGALYLELRGFPGGPAHAEPEIPSPGDVVVPLRFGTGGREYTFVSIVTSFGTPVDITVAELAIESFFPGDPATGRALHTATPAPG